MTSSMQKTDEQLGRRLDAVNRILKTKRLSKWAYNYWSVVHDRLLRQFHDSEHVSYKDRETVITGHTPPFDKVK